MQNRKDMTVIKVDWNILHVQGDVKERKFDLIISDKRKRKVSKIEHKKSIFCFLNGLWKVSLILSLVAVSV